MLSILVLIKTLIPFGIAFLFLWGIGRACCAPSKKAVTQIPKQSINGTTSPQNEIDNDDEETLFNRKQNFFSQKEELVKSRKELKSDRQGVFDSKQDFVKSKEELLSSKQEMMSGKVDMMTFKKSMIREASEEHSEGIDLSLALPGRKKRKLTPIQQSFLLKEILDAPKAVRPYKSRYPR